MSAGLVGLHAAVLKLDSFDADLRFMSLNDIQEVLGRTEKSEALTQGKLLEDTVRAVAKTINDPISEVQNQAVKTVGQLVQFLNDAAVIVLVDLLESSRSGPIKALALRALLDNCRISPAIASAVATAVSKHQAASDHTPSIEECEVVNGVVRRFGAFLKQDHVAFFLDYAQRLVQATGIANSGIIKRRAYDTMALLAPYESDELWEQQAQALEASLRSPSTATSGLQLLNGLCSSAPQRVATLNGLFALVQKLAVIPESEDAPVDVPEQALMALQVLYLQDLAEPEPLAALVKEFLAYHPNYVGNDSDGFESDDGEFEVSEDEMDEFDEDTSWKLRLRAAHLAAVLVNQSINSLNISETTKEAQLLEKTAKSLISPQVDLLRIETEESVRETAATALAAYAAEPAYARDVEPYGQTLLEIASKHASAPLLAMLSALSRAGVVGSSSQQQKEIFKLASEAGQRPSTLQVSLQLLADLGAKQRLSADPLVVQTVEAGLKDDQYQVLTVAVETAQAIGLAELALPVAHLTSRPIDPTLRALALRAAAVLATNQDVLEVVVTVLARDYDVRDAAAHALRVILEKSQQFPAAGVDIAVPVLIQMLGTTGTVRAPVIAGLRALELVTAYASRNQVRDIAAAVLQVPNDVALAEYRCAVLATIADAPGVAAFAESAAVEYSDRPGAEGALGAVAGLWGALAAVSSDPAALRARAREIGRRNPFWATVDAEITIKGNLSADIPEESAGEYSVEVILALAKRGKVLATVAELAGRRDVQPLVLGKALAAAAVANRDEQTLLSLVDVERADVFLVALNELLGESPVAPGVAAAAQQLLRSGSDLDIVGSTLGSLVLLDQSALVLKGWPARVQLAGAQVAFKKSRSKKLRSSLVDVFVAEAAKPDDELRLTALDALGWALQTLPEAVLNVAPRILQLLAPATIVNPDRIRVMQVGPFRHRVDDGAATRKSAFEVLYSLTALAPERVIAATTSTDLTDILVRGLKDEHEIQLLALRILETLAAFPESSRVLAPSAQELHKALAQIEAAKVKETAVKQVHDRHQALLKAVQSTRQVLQERVL